MALKNSRLQAQKKNFLMPQVRFNCFVSSLVCRHSWFLISLLHYHVIVMHSLLMHSMVVHSPLMHSIVMHSLLMHSVVIHSHFLVFISRQYILNMFFILHNLRIDFFITWKFISFRSFVSTYLVHCLHNIVLFTP